MPGDFTIGISPTSGSGQRTYTVTVTSTGGFMGMVSLAASVSPNATCSILPASVMLGPGTSANATVTVGTVIESSTLTATGTSGSLQHSAQASLSAGSFTVDITPASGDPATTFNVTLTSVNNFWGLVTLNATMSPSGNPTLNALSLTVPVTGSVATTCTVANVTVDSTLTVTGSYTQNSVTLNPSDTAAVQVAKPEPPNVPPPCEECACDCGCASENPVR
jgi:hypothetical protein